MNHKAWLLHQILIYSFTNDARKNPETTSTELFAEVLIDRNVYGQVFLNIIQVKCQYLLRYLIASLLICRDFEALEEVVLPIIIEEKSKYSDVFTQYVEALFDEFNYSKATSLAQEIGKVAQDDILLAFYQMELQA